MKEKKQGRLRRYLRQDVCALTALALICLYWIGILTIFIAFCIKVPCVMEDTQRNLLAPDE